MQIDTTANTMEFNFSDDIKKRNEMLVLNRPFIVGNNAFAVFTKHPTHGIVRVDFGCEAAENKNQLGPTWESKFWAHRRAMGAIEEPSPKALSLNQIADYYLCRTGSAEKWDGKSFFDETELTSKLPSVKNAIPSYTLQIVKSKGGSQLQDTEYNSEVNTKLDAQQTPFSKNKS